MSLTSALYRGTVLHRRLRPKPHRLSYRVFWLLLDLDELDAISQSLRLFSRGRFNLLSFHDRDHGDGSRCPLRAQIEGELVGMGIKLDGGPIRVLTMPRVLGFVFNPISVFYCHRADGRLAALVYEVTSTFGERHAYVIPVEDGDADRGVIRQTAAKALYVSPFMDMAMSYAFRGRLPDEHLALVIDGSDAEGLLIHASVRGRRAALTDGAILRSALAVPFLTVKVVAAIHWEALKLWARGIPLTRRPSRTIDIGEAQVEGLDGR